MRSICALPLLLAISAASPLYHYRLDGDHSDVDARVGFFGVASKTAHFSKMSGAISLQPDRLDAIDLDVELDARALTAADSATLGRLKGPNFFDVDHTPTVSFAGHRMMMTGPVTATVDGEITARGVRRPVVLQVAFSQPPAKATGREPIQFSARAMIDRRDFGMTAYSFIVSKKVAITISARMVPG